MEQEGLGREIEIDNEPADGETQPLLPPRPQAAPYEQFRAGREQLQWWIMPALFALKISFWSLGMRGYRVWKYITYTLLVMGCAYYIFFKLYCDPLQSCPLRKMEDRTPYHAYRVAYISNFILAMASILSCLAFIGCCMIADKRQTSALMKEVDQEVDQVNLFRLFLAFLIMIVLLTTSLIFKVEHTRFDARMTTEPVSHKKTNLTCKIRLSPGPDVPRPCEAIASAESTQFLLHFICLNICHIFAAVCKVLGKLTYLIFLKKQ